jgi:hypothetical protein
VRGEGKQRSYRKREKQIKQTSKKQTKKFQRYKQGEIVC